jgi:hypothetical protein
MKSFKIILLYLVLSSNICCAYNLSDTAIIRSMLRTITKTDGYRTHQNIEQLNKTSELIRSVFLQYSTEVSIQEFPALKGKIYRNVICSFGTENTKRIIVGAHYDVCGDQEGADDNASGIVGLLELARLLKGQKLSYRIDLVAYSLEEPPYFETEFMGSYVHAKSMYDHKTEVVGMVCLEMIGYFTDAPKSQSYPIKFLSLFYGNKGNYITLVKKIGQGKFSRKFCRYYKSSNVVRTKKFTGIAAIPGVDFSDHRSYWQFGYSALMITDSSFYRNKNYHENTDTLETLDLGKMAKVIDGVYLSLMKFMK